jgi:hypothetical protein
VGSSTSLRIDSPIRHLPPGLSEEAAGGGMGFSPDHFRLPQKRMQVPKRSRVMDVYAIVTEKVINLLERGVVPWRPPWVTSGLPRNLISNKPYRGVNVRREVA